MPKDLFPLPPGPKGEPFLGNAKDFVDEPLAYLQQAAKDHGDVMLIRLGFVKIFVLSHPDYIEQVLVNNAKNYTKSKFTQRKKSLFGNGLIFSEGSFWLRQRRLMQPAFHYKQIAYYSETMVSLTQRMLTQWTNGQQISIHDQMMQLSLEIVVKNLFSTDNTGDAEEVGAALNTIVDQVSSAAVSPLALLPDWLPTPDNLRYNRALAKIDRIIQKIIQEHRQHTEAGLDLLSMLLQAEDEDGSHLTDKQLRDEVINLYIAGHETTALALTYSWLLLAQNPVAEATLHSELDHALQGRTPTMADLSNLPYTEQIVTEALRLYPPVWGIFRDSKDTDQIGGYTVPPKTIIMLPTWNLHHDPRFFEDPMQFRPERWQKDQKHSIPRYAYFPFGGGQRLCIGNIFAMVEARLMLATIAQNWCFSLLPDPPLELVPTMTVRPKHGIKMIAHRRVIHESND